MDAARSGAVLYLFGAALIALESSVIPSPRFPTGYRWAPFCLAAAFAAAAVGMWRVPHRLPTVSWLLAAIFPVGAILLMALASDDPSSSSQLAFCWPVLFASYHLRPTAARVVVGSVVAAEVALCVSIAPRGVVVEDAVGVSLILIAVMFTLVRARERVDASIRRLRHDAEHDAVTGLLSRRGLDKDMQSMDDEPTALIVVDLDEFKSVNDTFGHAIGDEVLRVVAGCLVANGRADDDAYRLGGDEFAVVLRGCRSDVALRRAEEIRLAVEALPALPASAAAPSRGGRPGGGRHLTVSIGVACFPEHSGRRRELLAIADEAMYRAKVAGRNRVVSAPHAA